MTQHKPQTNLLHSTRAPTQFTAHVSPHNSVATRGAADSQFGAQVKNCLHPPPAQQGRTGCKSSNKIGKSVSCRMTWASYERLSLYSRQTMTLPRDKNIRNTVGHRTARLRQSLPVYPPSLTHWRHSKTANRPRPTTNSRASQTRRSALYTEPSQKGKVILLQARCGPEGG